MFAARTILLALTAAAAIAIVMMASLLSVRRILMPEPAAVFQGGT